MASPSSPSDGGVSLCQLGGCPAGYSLNVTSPSLSPCSSIQGDLSPVTLWIMDPSQQNAEMYQTPFDAAYFDGSQTNAGMMSSLENASCLDQAVLNASALGTPHGAMNESVGLSNGPTGTSERRFGTFEPVSTVASRNEVGVHCSFFEVSNHDSTDIMILREEKPKTARLKELSESVSNRL